MTKTSRLVSGLTGLMILLTTACSGHRIATDVPAGAGPATASGAAGSEGGGSGLSTVLFLGDSIAEVEALPLTAAFAAGGVNFKSLAAAGGGNVVGPNAAEQWKELPGKIASARPAVVIYQITSFDWGSRHEQQAAYRKLLTTVTGAGARLVFVTVPPIRPDDFYRPHLADLDRTADVARAVAQGSPARAGLLDATAVWGSTFQRDRNGRADRSTDGIHPCQQGAARFAAWLLGELAKLFPGFAPPDPRSWADAGWTADDRFRGC